MDKNIIYRLSDGRLWSVARACWLEGEQDAVDEGARLVTLVNADGESDEAYLARSLEFYGFPLGELAGMRPEGIRAELQKLDGEYLTARTLAGLATGDAEALARWQSHEEKAAPLRELLRQCEAELEQGEEEAENGFGS